MIGVDAFAALRPVCHVTRRGLVSVLLITGLMGACVQNDPQARYERRRASQLAAVQRGDITLRAMTIHPGPPIDRDGDRLADIIPLVIYIYAFFPEPIPVQGDGGFYFELLTPAGDKIADWTIDSELASRIVRQLNPGMGYPMELRLPKNAMRDNPGLIFGELICEYQSDKGGAPVRSSVAVRLTRR